MAALSDLVLAGETTGQPLKRQRLVFDDNACH